MRPTIRPLALIVVAISALSAAIADDVVGSWVVDGDASWAAWQDRPEMAKVPAEMRDTLKASVLAKLATMAIEITPSQMTRTDNGRTETSAYKIVSSEADALTIESTAADGAKTKGRLQLKDGRLRIAGVDESGAATAGTLVLRKRTAADGAKPASDAKPVEKPQADAPAKVVNAPSE